jgi:hypothetical protein
VSRYKKMIFARLRFCFVCFCLVCVPAAAAWISEGLTMAQPIPRREIYRGVYYQSSEELQGMVHLIEVDLQAPGIELFLTPRNADASASGHQYRLDYVRNVARAEGLAVAVNGTMFSSDSYLVPMVGDFGTSIDTIVSNYELNHLQPRDFMLWFDDKLNPHLETTRPAPPAALNAAKWAIGTQNLATRGKTPRTSDERRDKRCAIGVDIAKQKLWIGVFASASRNEVRELLWRAGAEYVMSLDGGDSTSLYLGGRAFNVPHGLRLGGQRPVATVFGIRADPLLRPI